jgi:hypothetical protein
MIQVFFDKPLYRKKNKGWLLVTLAGGRDLITVSKVDTLSWIVVFWC